MDRRSFLRWAATAGLGLGGIALDGGGRRARATAGPQPNILIIITDEQRAPQHWPAGWADRNLPSFRRLRRHGLNFTRAFTNACQCSPSRATLLTGQYAPKNKVLRTSGTLSTALPNLATILSTAGYNVVNKGKWHLTEAFLEPYVATNPEEAAEVVAHDKALADKYGFLGWNAPDSGTEIVANTMATLGGGVGANDPRYVSGVSPGTATKNALEFLATYDDDAPFCLILSLVNPHDVFVYPHFLEASGYELGDFSSLPIRLPLTFREDLSTKPPVQANFVQSLNELLPIDLDSIEPLLYARFYAYLNVLVDRYVTQVLDAVDTHGWTDSTLIIRIADHGEMGMAHGGLRQKDYTAYEEMIRVPMVFSNPILFPGPLQTDALAGLIDILPTLVTVAVLQSQAGQWELQGRDLTPLFAQPRDRVQDQILFTYDDQLTRPAGAGHIRCLRGERFKYSLYFDPAGQYPDEYEMYDLLVDPYERVNLAHGKTPPVYRAERRRLHGALHALMKRTGTLPQDLLEPDGPVRDPLSGSLAS